MTIVVTQTTVTLSYTATQAQLTKVLTNAAQRLYPHYPVMSQVPPVPLPFESLTQAQKLAVIDQYVRQIIITAALENVAALALLAAQADDQSIT